MSYFKGLQSFSRKIVLAIALCMLLATPHAFAVESAQKIGVVDYAKIFQQMPETKAADQSLKASRDQSNAELSKLQNDLQNAVQAYLKQKATLTKPVQTQKEKELQLKDQNLKKAAAEKSELLSKKEQELIAPISQKIVATVEAIAKREGYSMIFDRNIRVYGDAQYDITFKVLDQLGIKK